MRKHVRRKPGRVGDEGSLQALDHAANWVRFADTKATILTAAFGVVTTLLMNNIALIVQAAMSSESASIGFGSAVVAAAVAFFATLGWLLAALLPRRGGPVTLNRFSWPSLISASPELLEDHAQRVTVGYDAREQSITLAKIANAKFGACHNAAIWFGVFVIIVALTVGMAAVATSCCSPSS